MWEGDLLLFVEACLRGGRHCEPCDGSVVNAPGTPGYTLYIRQHYLAASATVRDTSSAERSVKGLEAKRSLFPDRKLMVVGI